MGSARRSTPQRIRRGRTVGRRVTGRTAARRRTSTVVEVVEQVTGREHQREHEGDAQDRADPRGARRFGRGTPVRGAGRRGRAARDRGVGVPVDGHLETSVSRSDGSGRLDQGRTPKRPGEGSTDGTRTWAAAWPTAQPAVSSTRRMRTGSTAPRTPSAQPTHAGGRCSSARPGRGHRAAVVDDGRVVTQARRVGRDRAGIAFGGAGRRDDAVVDPGQRGEVHLVGEVAAPESPHEPGAGSSSRRGRAA